MSFDHPILGDPGADSGGEGKSKRAIFSRPFRLSLAPIICAWVSEDATIHTRTILTYDIHMCRMDVVRRTCREVMTYASHAR